VQDRIRPATVIIRLISTCADPKAETEASESIRASQNLTTIGIDVSEKKTRAEKRPRYLRETRNRISIKGMNWTEYSIAVTL
jgi:hypothetical protein